jgi:hypothetical protein
MQKIKQINCETGEVTERDETPEELAARQFNAQLEAEAEATRQSAINKLKILGLTDEEISAIIGTV